MYDLNNQGLTQLKNSRVITRKAMYNQPLVGSVDGSNRVFYSSYYPWDSAIIPTVYVENVAQDVDNYTVNYKAGRITFNTAPESGSITIDFTYIQYTDDELVNALKDGFYEFVQRLGVTWKLSDDGTHIYIVDSTGADPTVSSTTFSLDLPSQWAYILWCQYCLLRTQAQYTAYTSKSVYSGGVGVNNARTPAEVRAMLRELEKDACGALNNIDCGAGNQYGSYIGSPRSTEYLEWFKWQGHETITGES